MNESRYKELMEDESLKLTQDEIICGWHFCPEWDGLLIGPGMEEFKQCCICGFSNMNKVKYPNINVELSLSDGNAFAVIGKVRRAMIEASVPDEDIKNFMVEALSDDYNHLLFTCMKWVNVS